MQTCDYVDLAAQFPVILHILCLIYSESEYFSKPIRIITIIRELCNLIIDRTTKYFDSATIFQIEPEEAMEKASISFKCLKQFKSSYKKYKSSLPTYFKNKSRKPKYWYFMDNLIFDRFDAFIERFKILNEFCTTSNQIFKLQKVEIGGVRGRVLSEEIKKINEKFSNVYSVFGSRTYDCLHETDGKFLRYVPFVHLFYEYLKPQ